MNKKTQDEADKEEIEAQDYGQEMFSVAYADYTVNAVFDFRGVRGHSKEVIEEKVKEEVMEVMGDTFEPSWDMEVAYKNFSKNEDDFGQTINTDVKVIVEKQTMNRKAVTQED